MGSPLGPIPANIFMVELKRSVIPGLTTKLNNWIRYVDDTIFYIKVDSIDYVLSKLNNFHKILISFEFTILLCFNYNVSFRIPF